MGKWESGKVGRWESGRVGRWESGKEEGGEVLEELTREMLEAADNLEFERAAYLRDQIKELKKARRVQNELLGRNSTASA